MCVVITGGRLGEPVPLDMAAPVPPLTHAPRLEAAIGPMAAHHPHIQKIVDGWPAALLADRAGPAGLVAGGLDDQRKLDA